MASEDEGDAAGRDRRLDERAECDIEARVELSDHLAIACRIKDLSGTGFRIEIAESLYLPDEFDLLIPVIEGAFQRYRVRMVWRTANMATSSRHSRSDLQAEWRLALIPDRSGSSLLERNPGRCRNAVWQQAAAPREPPPNDELCVKRTTP